MESRLADGGLGNRIKTKMQNIKHWIHVIKLSIDVRTEKLSDGVQVVFTCPASHFSPIIQTVVNNLVFF